MTSRPWYAFYPKDYEQKTAHLTLIEDGAYRRLLDRYYMSGKPLPANAGLLHRICRAFDDAERAAIDHILTNFFILTPYGYVQDRVQDELRKAETLSETRRNAANARYANAPANAEQKHTQSQSQSQSQSQEQTHSKKVVASAPATASTKGTRWESDRVVPKEWIEAAHASRSKHLHPLADLDTEAEKFANFWASKAGKDGTKLDWKRTWINWALTAKGVETNGSGKRSTAHEDFARGAILAAEEYDRKHGN